MLCAGYIATTYSLSEKGLDVGFPEKTDWRRRSSAVMEQQMRITVAKLTEVPLCHE